MPVITLTHLPGTLGEDIARRLATKLGIPLWLRSDTAQLFLQDIASDYDIRLLDESPKHYLRNASNGISFRDNIIQGIRTYADHDNAIILGIVPGLFLGNHPNAINIHVTAPPELREERLLAEKGAGFKSVSQKMQQADRLFRRYASILFNEEAQDPFLYHLTINTGKISTDAAVNMIAEAYRDHLAREILVDTMADNERLRFLREETTKMKNPSEISFAKVLDMYHIKWVYEPKTFPLEWNADGTIKKAFSPDFFLPEYNLYLELTVMNPKYSSEKKQKVRMIQELYPGTKVSLVSRKDFLHALRSLERASQAALVSTAVDEEQEWHDDMIRTSDDPLKMRGWEA